MAIRWKPELVCEQPVDDLEAGIAWYRDVLGLELTAQYDEASWASMKTPIAGVEIGLSVHSAPGNRGGTTLVLEVEDLDEARSELESKGVEFTGPTDEVPGMVKLAIFHDPWSNQMALSQVLAGAGEGQ